MMPNILLRLAAHEIHIKSAYSRYSAEGKRQPRFNGNFTDGESVGKFSISLFIRPPSFPWNTHRGNEDGRQNSGACSSNHPWLRLGG